MDAIRVPKVENVSCSKAGKTTQGTLHLTAHHLIFRHETNSEEEMWVPYPLISLVTRLPQMLSGRAPLTVRTRTFETFSLVFGQESEAIDVFDSVRELTVISSVQQLYAFFYAPSPPFWANDGWTLYNPRDEFLRMGVGSRTKAWRFTDLNKDYSFCPTYPAKMVVPTRISDTTLQYASKYRSKCRIPALTYLHWANYGSITRSSQPMVGITQNRSVQDEKLIEAIFQSHMNPESRAGAGPVYGATTTNLIIDARPTANAVANTAKGAGTENMDHYKDAKKAYLGIDHIHTMRESLGKVVEVLRETELVSSSVSGDLPGESQPMAILDRHALRRSGWLRHMSGILEGTLLIVKNVHVNSSHVLIHCSDGWDRTAQLSSLTQLCLDPYYRTIRGFQVLVEKDWVSFGHKFLDRCGHLSSEKFFVAPVENTEGGGGAEAAQAFFASIQKRFVSQSDIKETSPVFHQFLECVRQIQRQFPERFEFSEQFLRKLHYHLYSCQFGTFLFNSERDRRVGDGGPPPCERTVSVWDYFNSEGESSKWINSAYDKSLDDPTIRGTKSDMGVLFPNSKDVRFWHELYGRGDEEMNGRIVLAQVQGVELLGPVESGEDDPAAPVTPQASVIQIPPSPATSPPPVLPPSSPVLTAPPSSFLDGSEPTTDDGTNAASSSFSQLSLRPTSASVRARSPSPSPSATGSWRANRQSDWSGGVKSVWGRLSYNASAAFSAVQGAYDGVARDLNRSFSQDDGNPGARSGELQSREQISDWGQPSPTTPVHRITPTSASNPWATVNEPPRMPSLLVENPWDSVRSTSPRQRPSVNEGLFEQPSSFPHDPTISLPTPRSSQVRRSSPLVRPVDESPRQMDGLPPDIPKTMSPLQSSAALPSQSPSPPPPSNQPRRESIDPLGVGLW